jgi:hypothetical protein
MQFLGNTPLLFIDQIQIYSTTVNKQQHHLVQTTDFRCLLGHHQTVYGSMIIQGIIHCAITKANVKNN